MKAMIVLIFFFFSSRRRHTRLQGDWSSDVCSSDLLRRKTDQMAGLIDQMVDKVRTLATELRPAVLDSLGLSAAVEWAVRQFAERTGIECTLDLPQPVRIDAERSTDVFRILQETLTNLAR